MRASPLRAVITAAGFSRRMGRPKGLLVWEGKSLLERMAEAAEQAGLSRPSVVVGAHREQIEPELRRLDLAPVFNPLYERGRFTSVRVAARWALDACREDDLPPTRKPSGRALEAGGAGGLLLWPVDCPGVLAETLRVLAAAAAESPAANIVPSCENRGGHPVVLCAETLRRVAASGDDANLRELMHGASGGRRMVPVADQGVLENLNTPEEYEAFLLRWRESAKSAGGAALSASAAKGGSR